MITLCIIGIVLLTLKIVGFAWTAAWGIAKIALAICLPLVIVALLLGGLITFALPILCFAILTIYLVPLLSH